MYGFLKSEEECVADECVTDGDLVEDGDLLMEECQVLQREVMPGVQSEAKGFGEFGRLDEWGDGGITVMGVIPGVRLGVEFYAVGTCACGGADVFEVCPDEDRDTYSPFMEKADEAAEVVVVFDAIPPAIRRKLRRNVRNERNLVRNYVIYDVYEAFVRVALNVKFGSDLWA